MQLVESLNKLKLELGMRMIISGIAGIPPSTTSLRLIESGWGNDGFRASRGFLQAVSDITTSTKGPILELGTGLTTILLGAIAARTGVQVWSLEHSPEFFFRISNVLNHFALKNVSVRLAELKDYGDFSWYNTQVIYDFPDSFSLVVADGPPGNTKGGRIGLLPLLKDRLSNDVQILLDDAERESETITLTEWERECGIKSNIYNGTNGKKWALCTFNSR